MALIKVNVLPACRVESTGERTTVHISVNGVAITTIGTSPSTSEEYLEKEALRLYRQVRNRQILAAFVVKTR
ncbi:MAG: hypothetical protein HQL50_15330 [Magnetococcales bacterium]|nr:hypothetical protein [Magnetococcales bacterium]